MFTGLTKPEKKGVDMSELSVYEKRKILRERSEKPVNKRDHSLAEKKKYEIVYDELEAMKKDIAFTRRGVSMATRQLERARLERLQTRRLVSEINCRLEFLMEKLLPHAAVTVSGQDMNWVDEVLGEVGNDQPTS